VFCKATIKRRKRVIDQVIKSLTVISLVIGIVLGLLRIKQALTERRVREMAQDQRDQIS
jgi:uncharacterized membrane-anchored protein YhcB (DUF1043 family)